MRDVANLMAENRCRLERRQRLEQGVAQQDIAKARQDAGDTGVHHHLTRIPDEYVRESKTHPLRRTFEPPAQCPRRQRRSRPRQANEER